MKHLLAIGDLTDDAIQNLLELGVRDAPLVSGGGKVVISLFFEASTRTTSSFALAARHWGASCFDFPMHNSSREKGETDLDTVRTLVSMQPNLVVIRHKSEAFIHECRQKMGHLCSFINAGNGMDEHPTQALGDVLAMLRSLQTTTPKDLQGKTVLLCGDLLHSRVYHSHMALLPRLGMKVIVFPHPSLRLPSLPVDIQEVKSVEQGLSMADFVMLTRLQEERHACATTGSSTVTKALFLTHAKRGAKILHPGPFLREKEIASDLVDDEALCLVWKQVEAGVRMRHVLFSYISRPQTHQVT